MKQKQDADQRSFIDSVYRSESRRVLATLIRLLGDFELAEEALHEAFSAALAQWPEKGIPANPRAWLVSTGRFKGIDSLRRRARFNASLAELAREIGNAKAPVPAPGEDLEKDFDDDQLRLIFTCCHPALAPEAQVALTLREVCGLGTEEIARAFLSPVPTVAQRIVRAKQKIRDARIPYRIPELAEIPERLDSVLSVIYLVFNEGYSTTSAEPDLCAEAIRLCRLLVALLPDPEAISLLALMVLHDSRSLARTTAEGDVILLENQDRKLWKRDQIAEGLDLVKRVFEGGRLGPYSLQAAIAAIHAEAATASETDWNEIVGLYDLLYRVNPSSVIRLNRAVAVAMRDGPQAGIELIDTILEAGELETYQPAHMALAELCVRMDLPERAMESFSKARELSHNETQIRYIDRRLSELGLESGGLHGV